MKKNFTKNSFTTFLAMFCTIGLFAQGPFTGKPRYQILTTQSNATLGIIQVEMFPTIAPAHVRNFDSLVNNKFYDTIAFHRVVPGFVIQGGDPNSRHGPVSSWGFGQPGQPMVKAEFSVVKHVRGILSAARLANNINSATSQFFICVATASNLDGNYSIYGRVTSGMNTVDAIVNTPTVVGTQRPVNKIEMFVTYIGSNDTIPQPPALVSPSNYSVGCDTQVVALKWNKVSDGLIYTYYISHDSLFSDTVKTGNLTTFSTNFLFPEVGMKYYWKVRVNNGGHFNESPVWNFTTAFPFVDTTGLPALRSDQKVKVYPNPSKEKFTFADLQKGSRIEVFNLEGKKVHESMVRDRLTQVDLGELVKGTYLYKVTAMGGGKAEGKLILE